MKNMVITEFRGKYAALSNFYETEVVFDGIPYRSAEAAYQAQKTLNDADRQNIARMDAGNAKRYCGLRGLIYLRPDWEEVKERIMRDVVGAKFRQNPLLRETLLNTGFAYLLEGNTWHDDEWGNCFCPKHIDTTGENKLGSILMELREKLRNETFEVDLNGRGKLIAEMETDIRHPNIRIAVYPADGEYATIAHAGFSPNDRSVYTDIYDGPANREIAYSARFPLY
jgi:ribA/ribD-fused uncharacterized protein